MYNYFFKIETEGKPYNENKIKLYIGILCIKSFRKRFSTTWTFLSSHIKSRKNSNNSKSTTALRKSNKNYLKKYQNDFKFIYLQFSDVGNHVTLISIYFYFGEK